MSSSTCVRCNAPRALGPECPNCGVIYAKAERRAAAAVAAAGQAFKGLSLERVVGDEQIAAFLRSVYQWMAIALAITAFTAWLTVGPFPILAVLIFSVPGLFWALAIAELGLVVVLSARVDRLASSTASILFVAYSVLSGMTLSIVLLVYTRESIVSTFAITSGMFGACAMFGTATRRDLNGIGQFLFMGLVGLVIASVVGIFWDSDGLQFLISYVGVIVFTGLAAYDAQRLKAMAVAAPEGQTHAYAIAGALALYLDFINLFLSLLKLLGRRR